MRPLLALFCALTVLLTGCASLQTQEDDDVDPNWEAFQQSQEQTAPEEAPPELPRAFSLPYHKDLTLDPITCIDEIQMDVASLLYEPLVRLGPDFAPVPFLCESWSWNDTGLICTLKLREDVFFSDGTPLTAADAVDTLRRAMASPRYGYRLRNVVSVAPTRSGEVQIALASPDRGLPALLDIPIVKRGTGAYLAPIGTGPYLLITGTEGDHLTAYPDRWQGQALPVEDIPLVHAKDRDAAMYLFSSHRVELLAVDPTSDIASSTGPSQSVEMPTTVLQFIGFNTQKGMFADGTERTAFSRGLPRDTLTEAFFSGHAEPAQFPIAPRSSLYPQDLEMPYDKGSAPSTAGTGSIRFLVNEEDDFRRASAQFIASSMADAGWDIQVQALPWPEYLAALEAGDFDLYYGEVRLTANWDLRDLLASGGALNYGGWADPVTDQLLAGFASSEDRADAARQLCVHLRSEAPIAPVCFLHYAVLTHPGTVEGISPAPSAPFWKLQDWQIHLADPAE